VKTFCTNDRSGCSVHPCRQLERSLMAALSLPDACVYPVTQHPRGSFENGAVLRRGDNFNKCFCYDVSKFQISRANIVMWRYIGSLYMFFVILNVLCSNNLLAVCRFVTTRRTDFAAEDQRKSTTTCRNLLTTGYIACSRFNNISI
jgi:hypothetical protein